MVDDAVVLPYRFPEEFSRRPVAPESSVVVWPLREVDGVGIYSQEVITLVKALRAEGVQSSFLHPADSRVFEVKKSFVLDAALAIGLNILSSAAWAGLTRVLRNRVGRKELELNYVESEGPSGHLEAWTVRGRGDVVLDAIEKLRSQRESEKHSSSSPVPNQTTDQETSMVTQHGPPAVSAIVAAGPDEDLRQSHLERQIRDRREQGDALLATAASKLALDAQAHSIAEQEARDGLALLARSLDWAEDSEFEPEAHRRLDEAGSWVRKTFGCFLNRSGKEYQQTCPVALAHNRIGMSIGGAAVRICSLCGGDFSECVHLPGTAYVVPGGADELGWCRICLAESCEHTPADRVRVTVVAIIRQVELEEISLVSKPAHPEARLTSVSVSTSDLQSALGPEFQPGMDVSCDKCLSSCGGLIRHDFGGTRG